jgi:lipopolysaccharide biosynthesis regulator YciM
MSMNPQQMQQMLAQYRQQFPGGMPAPQQQQLQGIGQVQQGLQAGPGAGANKTAGGVNGAAQLMVALMKAQKQKQIQQQLNQAQVNQATPGLSQQSLDATNAMTQQSVQQNPIGLGGP